jgi:hypothetical protein
MEHSQSITELAAALALAQGELKAVEKTGKSNFGKFVELGAALEHVLPILSKHGLSVTQMPITMDDSTTALVTLLMHKSGEWIKSTYPVRMMQTTPQGQGSAITYARRYALMAVVGIAGDDDDGEAGTAGTTPERRQASAPKPAKPLDPVISTAKMSLMLGQAKFASGKKERDEIIAFFTDQTGMKPTDVHESELPAILAHFKGLSEGVDGEVAV